MKLKIAIFIAAALISTVAISNALSITPDSTFLFRTGNDNSNPESNLFDTYGLPIVYKYDPKESGDFASSYETKFLDTPQDPSGAEISYFGGSSLVGYSPIHLLVKGGKNQPPAWYLYNLGAGGAGWNGIDTLVLSNFWPEKNAISHVTLFAKKGPSTGGGGRVPDGGTTIACLGMALLGLGSMRKLIPSKG